MGMHQAVTYATYVESSREKTGNIIMFVQFEEGNLLSETHDNTEISDKYDDGSTIPSLIS